MAKPTAPADPLADLRQSETAPAGVTLSGTPDPEPEAEPTVQLNDGPHDQLWHDMAVATQVRAWHDDETTASYLHHGGTCGCRYVATVGIKAVHGEPVEPELDDEQQED